MRNFMLIAQNVDTVPMLHALYRRPELWNADRFRTTYPNTPHAEVDDVLIRFSDPAVCNTASTVIGDDKPVWHPAASVLPWQPIVLDLMRRVAAHRLDRLLVTRLRPGGRIRPHADDQGDYVHDPERCRYHVVLQGMPGSLYINGDETVCMLTGSVWVFNPLLVHEVVNNSADDRLHLLVDLMIIP
jgi:Aspartyl/Asparaginyl beta-hydroxylase